MTNHPLDTVTLTEQDQHDHEEQNTNGLEQKAHQLAKHHQVMLGTNGDSPLLERLAEQERLLRTAHDYYRQSSEEELALSYAAEWLLDNFYIIQQALRQIKEDLPQGYYRRLPKLDRDSNLAGLPRIYAVAREIVLYDQCQLDLSRVEQFVQAYQQVTPLTMGEIWALPIMLRFVVLESLTLATRRLTGVAEAPEVEDGPWQLIYELADADVVAACIPALRRLGAQDWKEFFESVSLVEQVLQQDPVDLYRWMDFQTRNRYRSVIEDLAHNTGRAEVDIAGAAVAMARANLAQHALGASFPLNDKDTWEGLKLPRSGHVGFYLLGDGRRQLETRFNYHPSNLEKLSHWVLARPTLTYLGTIILLTIFVLIFIVGYTLGNGGSWVQGLFAGLLGFIPVITLVVSLVNWMITHLRSPQVLPKLNFQAGVPVYCRTMVVIPTLLTHPAEVESLLSELELHYLRNPDPHLTFALLTDFTDAPQESTPEDEALLAQARQGLQDLNGRYPDRPFYLFHRRRLWNPNEGIWMGWERKRGKLHEFNRLLRGNRETSYILQVGNLSLLPEIRYVITLDADTVLPRGSAPRLIATLAHPLNQALFDPDTNKLIGGYTVLQPRTEITPASANQSLFTRIFAGDSGIDLYTLAVSDVYQDLFGEGIYVGKGIYDVDAFERSLRGRVPENHLLSHDLFEGIFGRAGLVTDIILYEDYPAHYLIHIRRSHRWIRGDWQLLPWLMPRIPHASGQKVPNPLAIIDRWKILDNLRRSLLLPSLLLLFLAGWLWLPGSPLFWTLLGLIAPAGSLLTSLFTGIFHLLMGAPWREVRISLRNSFLRWLLILAFLPYETVLILDAIVATLVRVFITRRNMLQWTTAASVTRIMGREVKLHRTRRQMISAVLVSGALGILVYLINPGALPAAFPLLVTWLLSPEIAYWISRPIIREPSRLSDEQIRQLRTLARRTWLFFEQFIGPHDNWLPPDHFQENPRGVVAHRTSPTNIGLLLLSTLSAYDLGYIDSLELTLRLRSTFDTLKRLERYRGHFLNWLETHTLHSLSPRYVSTVDSGNLAACLLALKQGCLSVRQQSVWRWERWQGLLDTLALLSELISEIGAENIDETAAAFQKQAAAIREQVEAVRSLPEQRVPLLFKLLADDLPKLDQLLVDWVETKGHDLGAEGIRNLRRYLERVHHHLQNMQRQLGLLLPWLLSLHQPPTFFQTSTDLVLGEAWQELLATFPTTVRLNEIGEVCRQGQTQLASLQALLAQETGEEARQALAWCAELKASLSSAEIRAGSLQGSFEQLAQEAEEFFQEMDFAFLFNDQRQVFHIGYNLDTRQLDNNYYDLLASEARIASIVTMATNQIPPSHWLHLGRPLNQVGEGLTLLSWSGTMFEYLMPPLLMRSYEGTLLYESMYAATDHQIAYGRRKNVPWGISESGYYAFDASMNYQYRAFGVPGLGFKRGLGDDLVIAPYASVMALPLRPQAVMDNLTHLAQFKMLGQYGLYEALDFTQTRLTLGQEWARVASYMAHHQGMIMLSLVNYLTDDLMVRRFHAEPRIQSVELLLQERIPQLEVAQKLVEEETPEIRPLQSTPPVNPWEVPVESPMPQTHYLSNGRYSLLLTSAGAGYSHWRDISLTRWRADATLDNWGTWLYIQDEDGGRLWSATHQPTTLTPESQNVIFHSHMVEFRRRDFGIATRTEVVVAPDDDVEIRLMTLTNESNRPRHLRIASYGEVVLAAQGADERHQAFAKLFVQSEYLPEQNALLFRRRPRSSQEKTLYLAHLLLGEPGREADDTYESSRPNFLGRGRTVRDPAILQQRCQFSGTVGATLDPIFSLGQSLELEPHASTRLVFITLVGETRNEVMELLEHYRRWSTVEQAFARARTRSERELRRLGFDTSSFEHGQQLLGLLLYPHPVRRAEPGVLAANEKGQPGLWPFGISGDYPILLVNIEKEEELPLVQDLLRIHTYWRNRQLKIDLVILNQEESGYGQVMQGSLFRLIHRSNSDNWLNQRGGIFVLRRDQMSEADIILLQAAARVVLWGGRGSLGQQLAGLYDQPMRLPLHIPLLSPAEVAEPISPLPRPENLQFDNGLGGFSADGREYLIYLQPGQMTPAPWINVIANEEFGFIISETGGGNTWAINSGENRLSSWRNDPVTDLPSEVLYLRDEETAEIWSPTPQPAPASEPYLVRHGAGYTIFEHHSHGLRQQLRLFTVADAPVKIVQLRVENLWRRPRRLTATYYLEWVLGTSREINQQHIVPEYDEAVQALLAYNHYNMEFGERVAFVAASKPLHGLTADRAEFLGRMGDLSRPAALRRVGLEGRVEAGGDPCAALQLHLDLAPGETEEIYFLIGQGADREESLALIRQYQNPDQVAAAWEAMGALWNQVLQTVQVDTPDPAMNLLLNGWLLYQALSCRIWGRSALYQSSGAYGFRDQLQDVMCLLHARPDLAREQILRAARHQFTEGDVLHWWHPPSGRGVRTLIRDDLLWLPFVTAHYVAATGDEAILQEKIPFLKGEPLKEGEEERYGHYETTRETYSLLEHCRRVLHKGDTQGPHGLPLMGGGDWNDGMNRVGIEGRGESVWLGWFLHLTLTRFAELCEQLNQAEQAAAYRKRAEELRQAMEAQAWDGGWYRRAYYDDGTPLGSSQNRECQIDAIAQSWAVISGAADPDRARQAMAAVLERLVKWDERLLLLFTPPFDQTPRDPGYIKGYLPGIRENGGQYTHAALWTIWAVAELGDGDGAEALFRLINPVYRADTPEKSARYQVEPYVISADVYSVPPHTGRGGWTWYTGSSGWMYRLGVEAILGLRREAQTLWLDPRIPGDWPGYSLTYRCGQTTYEIRVKNPDGVNYGVKQVILDGKTLSTNKIPLTDDGQIHQVQIILGPTTRPGS